MSPSVDMELLIEPAGCLGPGPHHLCARMALCEWLELVPTILDRSSSPVLRTHPIGILVCVTPPSGGQLTVGPETVPH